jgi:hypothetical protein
LKFPNFMKLYFMIPPPVSRFTHEKNWKIFKILS